MSFGHNSGWQSTDNDSTDRSSLTSSLRHGLICTTSTDSGERGAGDGQTSRRQQQRLESGLPTSSRDNSVKCSTMLIGLRQCRATSSHNSRPTDGAGWRAGQAALCSVREESFGFGVIMASRIPTFGLVGSVNKGLTLRPQDTAFTVLRSTNVDKKSPVGTMQYVT